jgi:hypothetical protein
MELGSGTDLGLLQDFNLDVGNPLCGDSAESDDDLHKQRRRLPRGDSYARYSLSGVRRLSVLVTA